MKREEAQFILGAYRPNGEDAHDPQFQEALVLARQDPVLGHWFLEEQALDSAFAFKIRSQRVPSDLKAQLLLARTTGVCTPRWRRTVWLAAAACIAVLLVISASLFQHRTRVAEFAQFRRAMVGASFDMSQHSDVMGLDADGFKHWLADHHGEPDFVLPAGLSSKGIAACKIVEWQQRRVTMLCFKFSGRHVDVFVVKASDLPAISLGVAPTFFSDDGVTTAAWQRDGKVYLLAGSMPQSDLQQLL